jgi:hypothetical protein
MKKRIVSLALAIGVAAIISINAQAQKGHQSQVIELTSPTVSAVSADVAAQGVVVRFVPNNGVVYWLNPLSGEMSFLLSFTLAPGHNYLVEGTTDAVTYIPLYSISTVAQLGNVTLSYTVTQCGGLWPRVSEVQ